MRGRNRIERHPKTLSRCNEFRNKCRCRGINKNSAKDVALLGKSGNNHFRSNQKQLESSDSVFIKAIFVLFHRNSETFLNNLINLVDPKESVVRGSSFFSFQLPANRFEFFGSSGDGESRTRIVTRAVNKITLMPRVE